MWYNFAGLLPTVHSSGNALHMRTREVKPFISFHVLLFLFRYAYNCRLRRQQHKDDLEVRVRQRNILLFKLVLNIWIDICSSAGMHARTRILLFEECVVAAAGLICPHDGFCFRLCLCLSLGGVGRLLDLVHLLDSLLVDLALLPAESVGAANKVPINQLVEVAAWKFF